MTGDGVNPLSANPTKWPNTLKQKRQTHYDYFLINCGALVN